MERNKGLWQGGLLYGSLNAGFFILAFITLWLLGRTPLSETNNLDFLLAPAVGFIMLRVFKEQWNGGNLHFWQGMTLAFFYAMVMATLGSFFVFAFAEWISPESLASHIELLVEEVENKKVELVEQFDEATYQEVLRKTKETTPGTLFLDAFLRKGFVALMATSFIAIFMRKTEAR
ncbi:MAG TPA: hypothetical protein DCE41_24875 [Cytophagales bacterium]|nr:hypothetical protein [Cytophagales bacterium]HAA23230.1 hypothetical protein [Cytophagales bacterium]HAP58481.1 hypothetical protein [Cytophagales bacterium]